MNVGRSADAALFAATPLMPMPRFSELAPLAEGQKRLIGACNGLYLQAITNALDVCVQVSEVPMPYGVCFDHILCRAGPVPKALLKAFIQKAQENPTREVAAAIVREGDGYQLVWPSILNSSGGHVRYVDSDIDDDRLVIDLHSHGRHRAFFSGQDDQSDLSRRGPYLAMVVGRCDTEQPELAVRVAAAPYLVPVDPHQLSLMGVVA